MEELIGGDVKTIKPIEGDDNPRVRLGTFDGSNYRWAHHEVVVKDGRVYDMSTGHEGVTIDEYKAKWDDRGSIIFGF